MIKEVVGRGGTVGIDAPFGWPDAFVDQLVEYREHGRWSTGKPRDGLCWRATDAHLKAEKIHPLSVSTDRIGVVAMRCAHLLTLLAEAGIARDPLGRQVVEVYPGGALRRWGLDPSGYKQRAEAREVLMRQLPLATVVADAGLRERVVATDHAFDALVSALVARDVALGRAEGPKPPVDLARLGREGWIWMPRKRADLGEHPR
jgi:predicted nuclease with RNAse H fold